MITRIRKIGSQGRPGIPEATKDRAVEMFNSGKNCTEIIQALNISKASFYRILKEREEIENEQ